MRKTIDVNSDLGEGFGIYKSADDETLLGMVSSANVACGFHAGDPVVMDRTVRLALARGVEVGAHIGYADRQGFGRRHIAIDLKELEAMTLYQLGALQALAVAAGHRVTHANFHGALGNLSFVDEDVASALMRAVRAFDRDLIFLALPNTAAERAAEREGLRVVHSFLADRAYDDQGLLVSRKHPNAMVKEPEKIRSRVARLLQEGVVETVNGKDLRMDARSILVHSDTPGAVELGRIVIQAVGEAGAEIRPLSAVV